MSSGERMQMASSQEAEIIRQIEVLVRKLASGNASPSDIQMLQDLQKARVDLMRPKSLQHGTDENQKIYA
jgi:hypothetical protein